MVSVLLAEPRPRFRWSAVSGRTIQPSTRMGTGGSPRSAGISAGRTADDGAFVSQPSSGTRRLFMMRFPASAHPYGLVSTRFRSAGFEVIWPGWRRGEAHPADLSGTGREASEGLRTGFGGDNRLGHRALPQGLQGKRSPEEEGRRKLRGLVLRGWAARSAV